MWIVPIPTFVISLMHILVRMSLVTIDWIQRSSLFRSCGEILLYGLPLVSIYCLKSLTYFSKT
uniref:Protein PHLOEM PROTEIN 2-LIKE A1 n=1 Tax=Solanum tuberosum TaxID=4113 RepID=M1C9B6_SOLTU